MLNELLLLSGNDIPFPEAQITIHPPTLKEIAFIGEDVFFIGSGFLNFSKEMLSNLDKTNLMNLDDFDILMMLMEQKTKDTQRSVNAGLQVLDLIFPLYSISVRDNAIILEKDGQEHFINKKNFIQFKEILASMFSLNLGANEIANNYNPSGDMANRIAEKFKKRHETLSKMAAKKIDKTKSIAILSRYVSILAIGLQIPINNLMQCTVYQLYDKFQRFQLKMQWDAYIQARMAGAKDLEEIDNWMIDLREQGKNKK